MAAMAEQRSNPNNPRLLNAWLLHLQKLALELNCPLCLNLFARPLLLPCNHIFCSSCVPRSTQFESQCSICKLPYADGDLRPAPFMENIVAIYKSLDSTVSAHLLQSVSADTGKVLKRCPVSEASIFECKSVDGHINAPEDVKLIERQSVFSLTANKRVQVPCETTELDKLSLPRGNGQAETPNKGGPTVYDSRISNLHPAGLLKGAAGIVELGTPKMEANPVDQLSPGSPPSSGDETKGLDDDASDQRSMPGLEKYGAGMTVKGNSNRDGKKNIDRPASGDESCVRERKRQKKLDYRGAEAKGESNSRFQPIGHHEELEALRIQSEPISKVPHSVAVPQEHQILSNSPNADKFVCAFCQTSRLSEATGLMLHYAQGIPVANDAATDSGIVHVHSKCIEWAPRVYFEGEIVKNLEKELARSSQLKCGSCRLKGAALGCYVKSCRKSYHVPCAVEIMDCRWDVDNYLVLCPAHSSRRFPNEPKSSIDGKKNCPASTPSDCQKSNFWSASSDGAKKWVLCGSALSSKEKFLMVNFASMIGVTVAKFWNSDVTHVIAATDADGACTRTLKVLMGIVHGKWVLTIDWVKACMKAMRPMDEEPYEVSIDNHGCCEGPKSGRLRVLNKGLRLFHGLNFYFSGEFLAPYKRDLEELVIAAGGTIIKTKEQLIADCHDAESTLGTLVVYNLDLPQGCGVGEEVSIVMQRLDEADKLASLIGSRVIPHTWLLESIAASRLQPMTC